MTFLMFLFPVQTFRTTRHQSVSRWRRLPHWWELLQAVCDVAPVDQHRVVCVVCWRCDHKQSLCCRHNQPQSYLTLTAFSILILIDNLAPYLVL